MVVVILMRGRCKYVSGTIPDFKTHIVKVELNNDT